MYDAQIAAAELISQQKRARRSGSDMPTPEADVVVVGAGAAGAVMAARLSEDPSRSVLLLEAGPAYALDAEPEDLLNPGHVPGAPMHEWGYTARGTAAAPEIPVPRGKALGGSSAVNVAIAMRLRDDDVREWQGHGLEGWSLEEVHATFDALERRDGNERGMFPIHQQHYDELSTSQKAFVDAGVAMGFPYVQSFNGQTSAAVGGAAVNVVDGVRQHTGRAYLTAEIRSRANLTIRGDVLVDRVLLEDRRATGVIATDGTVFGSREVVLSAGAYGSPAILLRSGIGPALDLRRHGIDVVADLPVGQRLHDHPMFFNAYALVADALDMAPPAGALIWAATSQAADGELDLQVNATHLMDPSLSPTGGAIVLGIGLVRPESRGTLRLRSRGPEDPPLIDCNLLATERDYDRMVEGVKLGRSVGRHPAFARVIAAELVPGDGVQGDAELGRFVEENISTYFHPTATAPMGGANDPWAVVDSRGAVKGLDGLRVVDASIIPTVPSVATNLPTIMVAERIAETAYARGGASA